MEDATRAEVGVRELRDHLSRYLARVKDGEEVIVTEHGQAIAYLLPKPRSSRLTELIAAGRARPPRSHRRSRPAPVPFSGSDVELDDLVRQQKA
jgi:prevent-host-death family protein